MAVSATEVDNIIVRLIGDATSYQKMIDNAITSTKSATKQMEDSSKSIANISSSIGMLASSMSSLITATAGTGNTLSVFQEFDKALTSATAIMDVTDAQIQKIKKSSLDLAPAAGLGPEVLARGFYYLASTGLDAERAIASLEPVVNFAVAGNFDLARATTLASDAQAALGLKVKDVNKNLENLVRVTDVLTKGNILANTTTEQLSLALSTGSAAAAKTFGKSIEEVVAALAVYSDQGIKAQVAGNALSRVFRLLQYAGVTHAAQLKKLGIEIFDEAGKMKPIADIIENLEKVLSGYSDASRGAALETIGFEARVQQAVLPLIGTSKQLREFEKALKDSGGTTESIANKVRNSFSFQIISLGANIKALAVDIGSFFAPALATVARVINYSITLWRSLGDEVKNTTIAIGAFLLTMAGLGPLRTLLGAIGGIGVAAITPVIMAFTTLAKVIINPFLLLIYWFNPTFILFRNLITIIAAVVVAIQKVGGAEEAFRQIEEALIDLYHWLKPIGKALMELGTAVLQEVIRAFISFGEVTLAIIKNIASSINIDWTKVQVFLISSIRLIEFAIVNLGNIALLIGKGLAYIFSPLGAIFQSAGEKASVFALSLDEIVRHIIVITTLVIAIIAAWKILGITISVVTGIVNISIIAWQGLNVAWTALTRIFGPLIAGVLEFTIIIGKLLLGVLVDLVVHVYQSIAAFGLMAVKFFLLLPIILAYNAAIIVTNAVMATLNFIITVFETVMSLGVVSVILAIGAFVALIGVILAVKAVIVVLSLIISTLATGVLFLAISGIALLATGLAYLIAPIVGTYLALYKLTEALQELPTDSGPIKALGDTFNEWVGILRNVADAIRIDMDLAWKIFEAGVMLGVEQIRALWPPLWEFIKEGFKISGEVIKGIIDATFSYLKYRIDLSSQYWTGFINEEQLNKAIKSVGEGFDLLMRVISKNAGEGFKEAANKFDFKETPGIDKARKKLKGLEAELDRLIEDKFWEDFFKELEGTESPVEKTKKEVEKLTEAWKDDSLRINKVKHEVDNLTAAIYGTADAMTRLQHYTDLFFLDQGKRADINTSGITSGLKQLGIRSDYVPESAAYFAEKDAKAMKDAEEWAQGLGRGFVDYLHNNSEVFTAIGNTFAPDPLQQLSAELARQSLGLKPTIGIDLTKKSDAEILAIMERVAEATEAMAEKPSLADIIEIFGLE